MIRTLSAALLTVGLVLGATSVAMACGGSKTMEAKKFDNVDGTTLASWIEQKATKVFHAASEETFAAGTLPTSVRVDYAAMSVETLGANKDEKMTFLCANTMCSASKKAALAAVDMGYTDVWVYRDGVAVGYVRAGSYGHTLGGAVGLVMANSPEPIGRDFVKGGTWEVDIAGTRYPAVASLRPMYDPTMARIKA